MQKSVRFQYELAPTALVQGGSARFCKGLAYLCKELVVLILRVTSYGLAYVQ